MSPLSVQFCPYRGVTSYKRSEGLDTGTRRRENVGEESPHISTNNGTFSRSHHRAERDQDQMIE